MDRYVRRESQGDWTESQLNVGCVSKSPGHMKSQTEILNLTCYSGVIEMIQYTVLNYFTSLKW